MKKIAAGLISCAALLLAACSGTGSAGNGSGDLEKITVGIIPIADVAPMYLARSEGIFEEHGLDVEFQQAQGGAALIPAVVSSEYDYAVSNMTSLVIGSSKGLPLVVVGPGSSSTGEPGNDFGAIVAEDGSGIDGPEDLEGKRVAVNTLGNINDMLIKNAVEDAGGDPDEVDFVELAHADMPAALKAGDVDVIWEVEPFLTSVKKQQNVREVWSLYAEAFPDLTVSGYFTTVSKVESEPEQVEKFTAALTEAFEYANAHPDKAQASLQEFTEIDPELAEQMVFPAWPTKVNTDSVEFQVELAEQWGLIDSGSVTADELIRAA